MAYLEPLFLDDERETENQERSWECDQEGVNYHRNCKSKSCLCECHWDDCDDE